MRRHGAPRRERGDIDEELGRRLFIAVPIAEPVSRQVAELVTRLRVAEEGESAATTPAERQPGGVRWVRLDGLHLTVRFLGPTPDDRIDLLRGIVASAARLQPPFRLGIHGGGAFPRIERPRVLWLGIADPSDGFRRLAEAVGAGLVAAGWPADDRPATPHLTLARTDGVRTGPRVARRLVAAAAEFDAWFEATELVLFESHTGGGPARYEPLHVAALGPPSDLELRRAGEGFAAEQRDR